MIQITGNHKTHIQGRQSRSHYSDLGRTKNLVIYGQSLVFPEFWLDNNCQAEVLLKWSDQSSIPSPAPELQKFFYRITRYTVVVLMVSKNPQ